LQRTFVMIKPNGVQNALSGNILTRYESAGLAIQAISIKHFSNEQAEGFYAEHKGREFYEPLIDFMTSGPTIVLVLGGNDAIRVARAINGATNPENAEPGTIRFDHAPNTRLNVVHSSDSVESSEREISYWFDKEEVLDYKISKHTAV
jgi:nucleoside-diphosphate kinase